MKNMLVCFEPGLPLLFVALASLRNSQQNSQLCIRFLLASRDWIACLFLLFIMGLSRERISKDNGKTSYNTTALCYLWCPLHRKFCIKIEQRMYSKELYSHCLFSESSQR